MKTTLKAKLVAIQDGFYTNFVFQNLDEEENSIERYVTVTKCPNWQYFKELKIGDVGYLEYEFVRAGTDYVDSTTGKTKKYLYTANYFMNFIHEVTTTKKQKEFKF